MKGLADKVKLIYLPFLIIAVSFVVLYTLLHWLLIIEVGIPVKEDVVKFWLPFGLPWIPVLVWLRPRIKLLMLKHDNGPFFFQFLAAMAIAVPTLFAQEYLAKATGKMTHLDNAALIRTRAPTKYYTFKNYYVDKENASVQHAASLSGKHNEYLNLDIYIVMPIRKSVADTTQAECSYWIGKKYRKQISSRLSDTEKNHIHQAFAEQSQTEFEETDFSRFTYLEVVGNTDDHDEFDNAIKQSAIVRYHTPIVFEAKSEVFENKNEASLKWAALSFLIGLTAWFICLLFPKLSLSRLKKFKSGSRDNQSDQDFFGLLLPMEGFYVTPIIIYLNVILFIIMMFAGLGFISFKGRALIDWGANCRPLIINGQWWRLVTNVFLHGGIMHILANMYGLFFVGIFLEPVLGTVRYLAIYLITGIVASAASIWWYHATISVGASGAIFGLYGFFLASLLLKVYPLGFSKAFLLSTFVFVGFNLLMGVTGGIDNAAHIGGLLSGFIIGVILSGKLKREAVASRNKADWGE